MLGVSEFEPVGLILYKPPATRLVHPGEGLDRCRNSQTALDLADFPSKIVDDSGELVEPLIHTVEPPVDALFEPVEAPLDSGEARRHTVLQWPRTGRIAEYNQPPTPKTITAA